MKPYENSAHTIGLFLKVVVCKDVANILAKIVDFHYRNVCFCFAEYR